MSYQDDLDWLARNVHAWGEFGVLLASKIGEEVIWSFPSSPPDADTFTKAEWLSRRAELQAKAEPHPFTGLDEAIRKVLSVMRTEPEAFTPKELSEMKGICDAELAKLTDMHKNHEEIDMSSERVKKNAESVHDWHERVELPPVGTVCEAATEGCEYERCEILAYHNGQVALRWFEFNDGCLDVLELDGWSFRPIRTERDEAIEAMKAHCPYPGSWETTYRLFAESLYDAGYRAGSF